MLLKISPLRICKKYIVKAIHPQKYWGHRDSEDYKILTRGLVGSIRRVNKLDLAIRVANKSNGAQ